jgi:DNA (cytosine-5)-methyltransferase 1
LDLFCGAGGAAMGYYQAGFTEIVGIDVKPQPRYPFRFIQADAINPPVRLDDFDAIHASPPCQRYSVAQNASKNAEAHPDLVDATRELCESSRLPWVIENVLGAPMKWAAVVCGTGLSMQHDGFELRRHRVFESSVFLFGTTCHHTLPSAPVFGHSAGRDFRKLRGRDFNAKDKAAIMGIDWMNRDELSQAIPPAYTEFVGRQLITAIKQGIYLDVLSGDAGMTASSNQSTGVPSERS